MCPNHAFSLFINVYRSLVNLVTQKCIVGLPEIVEKRSAAFSLFINMYHSLVTQKCIVGLPEL